MSLTHSIKGYVGEYAVQTTSYQYEVYPYMGPTLELMGRHI